MPLTLNPPPPTPVDPVTEVLHGVSVTDPYRWLEDQNSPSTRKWLEQQATYFRAYVDAIPGRLRIKKRVEELLAVQTVTEPWKAGERYFYLKRLPHQEQAVIAMRQTESGEENVLVDPGQRDATGRTAVRIFRISTQGRFLAYSVRESGADSFTVEFLDVETGQILPDRLSHGFCRGVVFGQDNEGFYYSHEPFPATLSSQRSVRWHAFGTSSSEDTDIFTAGDDPALQLVLFGSPNSKRLGYYKLFSSDPTTVDFLLHDLATDLPPRLIVEHMSGIFLPFLLDKHLIALTDWKAPNCRVVAIDVDHNQPENWYEIAPESNSRIQSIGVADSVVAVAYAENTATRLDVFDFAGHKQHMQLPSRGTATILPSQHGSDTIFYRFTSFDFPPAIFRYRTSDGSQDLWTSRQYTEQPSLRVQQVHFPSKDGTLVPMFLVCQKGLERSCPHPTFLTGYGGFSTCITPQFTVYGTILMELGCLFAIANLRGGAEFGEEWHLAAKRHDRQKAVDDFISAAEWLLAEGHTTPGRLAIGGGSNAGLLVGAALTQRPDLFRAVICLGPLLDMLRYHKFDQANQWAEEYGSAENPDDFHYLQAYSPYHRVKPGVTFPAVMLISGDADMRCNPMHVRKMTAALQSATVSGLPVLLDYNSAWGHMPVQPLTRRVEALTNRLTFVCHELGIDL